jgi:hypothetical protein
MSSQTKAIKLLRLLSIVGLVVYGVVVSYQNAASAKALWNPDKPFDNPVDKWQKRMDRVRNTIPEGITTIGYAADWDLPGVQYNAVDQDAEYMITQYSLAPIQVVPGLDQEWVIGNFTNEDFKNWLDDQLSSYQIKDLGFGIYVIHRTVP